MMNARRHSGKSPASFPGWTVCFVILAVIVLAACPGAEREPGHLAARALFAAGGPETDDARFVVESADGERVAGPTGRSSFDLPPGTYRVTATLDRAEATAEARVRSGERTELDVVLNAGALELAVLLADEGEPATDARFRVLSAEKDIRGERTAIAGPTRRSSFVLQAGEYLVRASEDSASAEKQIEVRAGERHEVTVVLDAGLLHARALESDGTAFDGRPRWTILSATEDLRGRRGNVAGPTRRDQFLLPAGEYVLQVRADDRTAEVPIRINAGERRDVEVRLAVP